MFGTSVGVFFPQFKNASSIFDLPFGKYIGFLTVPFSSSRFCLVLAIPDEDNMYEGPLLGIPC